MQKSVILFDGECNLCTWSVRFIVERDPRAYFTFASAQSDVGRRLLLERGIPSSAVESVILLEGPVWYVRSDAALRIAARLGRWWPALTVLWLIPRPIRDWCYSVVARNRYRWFGRSSSCLAPRPELMDRFLA